MKWEYKQIQPTNDLSVKELNVLGQEGWELCTVIGDRYQIKVYIFKRLINE